MWTVTNPTLANLDRSISVDPNRSQHFQKFEKKGYLIYVGENADANDQLVASHPHRRCLWMHAVAARGAHVVLCLDGRNDVPEEVLQYAGEITIRYSKTEGRAIKVARLEKVFKPPTDDRHPNNKGQWITDHETIIEVA